MSVEGGAKSGRLVLSDYVTLATELQACCCRMTTVSGAQKLERRIGTEIKFFQTLSKKDERTQAAYLQSSNLSHFAAIVHAATHLPGVTAVLRPFTLSDRRRSLLVDVVADSGRSWVKVVARKGQALHLVWAGQGQYGERDMVQQLRECVLCADYHPVNFRPPCVHATFYNHVTMPMKDVLQAEGVTVWGRPVPVAPNVAHKLLPVRDDEYEDDDMERKRGSLKAEDRWEHKDIADVDDCGRGRLSSDVVDDGRCLDVDGGGDEVKEGRYMAPVSDFLVRSGGNQQDVCPDRTSMVMGTFSDNLESCDLETDCAGPSEDYDEGLDRLPSTHAYLCNEATIHNNLSESSMVMTSAWVLSTQSRQCLSRILAAYPDYSAFDWDNLGRASAHDLQEERGQRKGGWLGRVNLDITTLITLVSSVCHGGCNFQFRDKVLDQQAAEERQQPSLPGLKRFLQSRELIVCRSAWSDFNGIVQLLGGPTEQKRAAHLFDSVTIVDDQVSARAADLELKGKVKERSKVVFGTGDQLEAITVTANLGFVRAAENQGVSFAVYMHPARALTEQKESSAVPL